MIGRNYDRQYIRLGSKGNFDISREHIQEHQEGAAHATDVAEISCTFLLHPLVNQTSVATQSILVKSLPLRLVFNILHTSIYIIPNAANGLLSTTIFSCCFFFFCFFPFFVSAAAHSSSSDGRFPFPFLSS